MGVAIPAQLCDDLDDPNGRVPGVRRFGQEGVYQYVYSYRRQALPALSTQAIQPFRGVRICAPCDRFALFMGKMHNSTSNVLTQFDLEIWAGWSFTTERVFQGTTKFTSFQDTGLLVVVSGFPATGWDIWIRSKSASAADNYEISLNLLLDHGKGPFSTFKGQLMV